MLALFADCSIRVYWLFPTHHIILLSNSYCEGVTLNALCDPSWSFAQN